jgi:pimeloyl-ACP methyl ester carboxylesterase
MSDHRPFPLTQTRLDWLARQGGVKPQIQHHYFRSSDNSFQIPGAGVLAFVKGDFMDTVQLSRRSLLILMGAATAGAVAGCGGASAATTASTAATLFYTDVGTGKNVMFLHGWTCDSHDFSWQYPVFESKYRVVALDLRGHGRSEVMPSGKYLPADYVADIVSFISTNYPGQKFTLIGHSMGGQIAALVAASRPDLISAVVSVDGSLGFAAAYAPVFQQAADSLVSQGPAVAAATLFEAFYDPATNPAFKRWHARRVPGMPADVVIESFGPLFLGAAQVGVGQASAAFCQTLKLPFYHLCRDPVQASTMTPWFTNPKSKVDVWTNSGHWIMQDRPADFNTAVTAWIDAL